MKKSQMEMFGLAIIVILVFIGMMFLLMFYMRTPDTYSIKEKYNDQTMAQNLLDAVFSLNTTCSYDLQGMVKDCYVNYGNPSMLYKCNNIDSCTYTSRVFNNTLNKTLVAWSKPFKMTVFGEEKGVIYEKEHLNCIESVRGSRYISLFDTPLRQGEIEARLDVCR